MDNFNLKVKQEVNYPSENRRFSAPCTPLSVIDLSSSDSDADDSSSSSSSAKVSGKRSRVSNSGKLHSKKKKKKKLNGDLGVILPAGFLDPLPNNETTSHSNGIARRSNVVEGENAGKSEVSEVQTCKQFWKAADFDGATTAKNWETPSGGMDHVRVHPRFLHSNATSHKWVLGAFAELLDNALDEVCNGASYVNIDMIMNKKDRSRMLLIEDNGGGMDPDKMRQCMSLGYSLKSKVANTIGQYGNGFKTSTMRLGADVIVFSRCSGKDGKRSTQSIGLLSYTFLRNTGKEDIVVPMLDYERGGKEWKKMIRSSTGDWNINIEAVVQWSPFSSEADLLRQFDHMKDHGTRIIIYNLWEDDQGQLELDFDADRHDIQIRGVNRDEKSIQMAHQFPNSRHFLTYRHSLRSYASILYLRIPPGFRLILRGKDVEHHNIVNDMMMTKEVTYRPQPGAEGVPKETNMVAVVTMGFVKDAKAHIDVQGFNVYHKNRLIKPFWRLWNAAGSDGRGVIGVLEANFVEPAHDKQGFERTIVLSRLEAKLVQMQKMYWSSYCHKIGYAPRRNKNSLDDKEFSPEYSPEPPYKSKKGSAVSSGKTPPPVSNKYSHKSQNRGGREYGEPPSTEVNGNGYLRKGENGNKTPTKSGRRPIPEVPLSISAENVIDDNLQTVIPQINANVSAKKTVSVNKSLIQDVSCSIQASYVEHSHVDQDYAGVGRMNTRSQSKGFNVERNESAPSNGSSPSLEQLLEENLELKERLKRREEDILGDLLRDLESERERCKSLAAQLLDSNQRNEDLNKEQISLIEIFSEERERRDKEEENLRMKLKDASNTIQELLDKARLLEKMKPGYK